MKLKFLTLLNFDNYPPLKNEFYKNEFYYKKILKRLNNIKLNRVYQFLTKIRQKNFFINSFGVG
ncbi:hypothetical protein HMPREF1421_00241 [Helicobacter pylori GAM265BSii]|uniref:Uncharacterized protein n=1 Tax=Helicobacter pylori GAM265BSii TaxID=1159049 RepID=M3RGW6_HELPX|nr:hypothetical protein HMPREF1421_00241 [Helicobacter pylori GAM265BSii]